MELCRLSFCMGLWTTWVFSVHPLLWTISANLENLQFLSTVGVGILESNVIEINGYHLSEEVKML